MKLWLTTAWIRLRWHIRDNFRATIDFGLIQYDGVADNLDELFYMTSRYRNEHQVRSWRMSAWRNDGHQAWHLARQHRTFKINTAPKGKLP